MQDTQVRSLGQEDALEKEMAVFLPGKSHGQRSLGAAVHGVTNESVTPSDYTPTDVILSLFYIYCVILPYFPPNFLR